MSGPEIKNNGLAVKVGQVAHAEAHFFDTLEEADFKIRRVRTLPPLLVLEVIANTIAAIMAMDAAAAIPYLAKFFC